MPIGRLAAEATLNDTQIVEALKRIEQLGGITEQKLNEIVVSVGQIGTAGGKAAGGVNQFGRATTQATSAIRGFQREQRLQNFVVRESIQALSGAVFAYSLLTANQKDASDNQKKLTSAMLSGVAAFNAVEFIGFAVGSRFKALGSFITAVIAPLAAVTAGFLGYKAASKELLQTLDELIDKRMELERAAALRGKPLQEQLMMLNVELDALEASKQRVDAEETTTDSLIRSEQLANAILENKREQDALAGKIGQQEKTREDEAARKQKQRHDEEIDFERRKLQMREQVEENLKQEEADRFKAAEESYFEQIRLEEEAAQARQQHFEDTLSQIDRIGSALQRAFNADSFISKLSQALQIALQIARILGKQGQTTGLDIGEIVANLLGVGSLFFDEGGRVPGHSARPRMAVVHEGETVLPTHKYGLNEALSRALSRTGTHSFDAGGVVSGGGNQVISELREIRHMLSRIEPKTYVVGPTFQDALKDHFPQYDKFEKKKLP